MTIFYNIDDLPEMSRQLVDLNKSIAFYGEMGAGKTTLIKAMLRELGVVDSGHSPTFGLVNEYHNAQGELVAYHFDFYRLNSPEEALDMGIEAYFNSNCYIFMEWPERLGPLLPEDIAHVHLYFVDETTRRIEY